MIETNEQVEVTGTAGTETDEQTPPTARAGEIETLLRALQEQSARQTACLERQLKLTRLSAWALGGLAAVLLAVFLWLAPQVGGLLDAANGVLGQTQTVLTDLQVVSDELANAKVGDVLKNVDGLVAQGREGIVTALSQVQDALAVLQKVDIETLNRAIRDLQDVVAPLSKLFGGGG